MGGVGAHHPVAGSKPLERVALPVFSTLHGYANLTVSGTLAADTTGRRRKSRGQSDVFTQGDPLTGRRG